jgi:hypothetical protein
MISSLETARAVAATMNDMFQRVAESVDLVSGTCPAEDATAYRRATANIVGSIVFDVLEPLYEQHPSLKPANWDD